MTSTSPKIMILYASYGDGHYRASKAIEASFHSRGIRDVVLLDLMAEAHPLLNELTKIVYLHSFSILPSLYGWVYNATRKLPPGASFFRLINSFGSGKLKQSLASYEPDLIIHTFPQLLLPEMNKKTSLPLPLVNVMTDFDIHARWIHPGVDRYYVATEQLKEELTRRGVPQERIMVSGIPLRPDFGLERVSQAPSFLDKLDPSKKTVMLMAGAYGVMQGIREVCEALLHGNTYQILAVCGRNRELYQGLSDAFGSHPDFHLFGFVQEVAPMMHASDCIITKPGGITLSEALACSLPLFLYRPVPGQELNNARYLQSEGIAVISHNANRLRAEVDDLLFDQDRLSGVKEKMKSLRKPEAAEAIVNDILEQWFRQDAVITAPGQIGSAFQRLVIH